MSKRIPKGVTTDTVNRFLQDQLDLAVQENLRLRSLLRVAYQENPFLSIWQEPGMDWVRRNLDYLVCPRCGAEMSFDYDTAYWPEGDDLDDPAGHKATGRLWSTKVCQPCEQVMEEDK